VAELHSTLGEQRFADQWNLGREAVLEEVIDEALSTGEGLGSAARSQVSPAIAVLTRREREVAALIGQGLTNRQVADALVIAEGTAEKHVANIMSKLGLQSRTQLAVWTAEHGLVARH